MERRVIERERLQHELTEYDDKLNRQVEGEIYIFWDKEKRKILTRLGWGDKCINYYTDACILVFRSEL